MVERELVDGHVGGDVLGARLVERVAPALVAPEGAQPPVLGPGGELGGGGAVVDDEQPPAVRCGPRVGQPCGRPAAARDPGTRAAPEVGEHVAGAPVPRPACRAPRGVEPSASTSTTVTSLQPRLGALARRRTAGCRAARWRSPLRRAAAGAARRARRRPRSAAPRRAHRSGQALVGELPHPARQVLGVRAALGGAALDQHVVQRRARTRRRRPAPHGRGCPARRRPRPRRTGRGGRGAPRCRRATGQQGPEQRADLGAGEEVAPPPGPATRRRRSRRPGS